MIHEKIEIQLKDSEFKANLFTYFLDNSPEIDPERKRPVVLICPGGGYQMTSDREAEALAVRFMAMISLPQMEKNYTSVISVNKILVSNR